MYDNIFHIKEIRNDRNGEDEVNELLTNGWVLLSICQVSNSEGQDIVYIVGATKEVYTSFTEQLNKNRKNTFSDFLPNYNRNFK